MHAIKMQLREERDINALGHTNIRGAAGRSKLIEQTLTVTCSEQIEQV